MVTVVKTPIGHKITSSAIEGSISEDYSGEALVTSTYHQLGTGDYVYIDSDIDEYNGFWYVTVIDADTFKISEYPTADFVDYFQDCDIEYYTTLSHKWSSIFLPIVYKATNNKWPINTIDATTNINSTDNDNGYLEIITFGTIKSGIQALDYIKISGADDETVNGVHQVIEVISNSNVVLDLAYTSSFLTGATVQFYYNNYHVNVKIYAGLPDSHPWEEKKPFEEIAELALTPDENGLVMFSISDYIRGKTEIRNNLTLYSLPLNLDAFTAFYISVAEDHDGSDGYTSQVEEGEFTDDTFTGYAIAGKLPFKNIYSGDYANYVYVSGAPANWLTVMERLLAVEDKFFDVSFIKNVPGDFILQIDKYVSDYLTTTETVEYQDQGIGVYRLPITVDAQYDSFCIKVIPNPASDIVDFPAFNEWLNGSGLGVDWTLGSIPAVTLDNESTEYLYVDFYGFVPGYSYTIEIGFTKTYNSGSSNPRSLTIYALDSSNTIIDSDITTTPPSPGGSGTASFTFTATEETTRIGVRVGDGSNIDIELTSLEVSVTAPAVELTEEICVDIVESCDAASGFTPTDIRLLEDGSYRILE